MKRSVILFAAALASLNLFSCGSVGSSSSGTEKASVAETTAAASLPVIDKAEIVAEYSEGGDGYTFRLDVEGDIDYWTAEVTAIDCGEENAFKISTKDYDRNSRFIAAGSTITDISAVVTPYDKEGNAGKPVTVKWDPERKEKTTSENETGMTIEPASKASDENVTLNAIVGQWIYEEQDASFTDEYVGTPKGFVIVSEDGTYSYNDGASTTTGIVKIDYEEYSNGDKVPYYSFCSDSGEFWIGCYINQNEPDVFYIGNGGMSRLVRSDSSEIAQESNRCGDSFVGTWGSGRATLVVEKISNNTFSVYIKWSSSAAESTSWAYEYCNYSPFTEALVCEGGGVCTELKYSEDGKETVTTNYEGSNATFTLDATGKYMTWSDDKETSDEDMTFVLCE